MKSNFNFPFLGIFKKAPYTKAVLFSFFERKLSISGQSFDQEFLLII